MPASPGDLADPAAARGVREDPAAARGAPDGQAVPRVTPEGAPLGALPAPRPFEGFRTGTRPITLPAELFAELLPSIDDEAELRVTLHTLFAIGRSRGPLRAVRQSELARETALTRGLEHCGGADALPRALAGAVARGSLLDCPLDDGDVLYLVNNEGGRRLRTRIITGTQPLPDGRRPRPEPLPAERSGPATVYEQEIGTLTPAIASLLAEAQERYAGDWIIEALQLAATNNARSWRYAEAILRRWETEGRDDEATRGDARTADPYGHVYRRE
ncbi:MAG: DnaD domain protein [Chloroflexi bacterium]|nr:DnaD domain protein [Chloroflexota bacterium]MDA1146937.1 DnaD domain protein [Chloroflexota bacterium]